ncbi:hypothetical protein [Actinomadura sp. RB99]|uniref:hypothetical protein n=1 Tax=Actinomadura sp. RB99 TaxID=2691577 RepID=UPI001682F4CA|nr:hypothetical protein [Actinomadura sp. RB99]
MPSGNATSRTTRLVRSTSVAMLGYRAGRNGEWRLVQERAVAERRRELGTVFQFDSFFRASVASRSSPAAQCVTVAPCTYGMRCCAIRRVCHAVLAVVGLHAHATTVVGGSPGPPTGHLRVGVVHVSVHGTRASANHLRAAGVLVSLPPPHGRPWPPTRA